MGKSRRKRRHHRRRRGGPPQAVQPDEVVDAGPLIFARYGNVVRTISKLGPDDIAALPAQCRERLPLVRAEVDRVIQELLAILARCDPLDLFAGVALCRSFGDPESAGSGKDRVPMTDVEQFISLATARTFPESATPPKAADIQHVLDLLSLLQRTVGVYYMMADGADNQSHHDGRLAFLKRAETLFVRGDDYEIVACDLAIRLFEPVRDFMEERFGFNAQDLNHRAQLRGACNLL